LTAIGIGDEYLLVRLMLFLSVHWNIFKKEVPHAIA